MKPLILVVEDHSDMRDELKLILELNQYQVQTAIHGKDALKILSDSSQTPDLILSDIMMPEMNGYEFFQQVSKDLKWNHIPFIFLTAKASADDVRLGKMLGIDDYLVKPIDDEDLLASISGKLAKIKKNRSFNRHLEHALASIEAGRNIVLNKENTEIQVILVFWDEVKGPVVKTQYPEPSPQMREEIKDLGVQLFQTSVSLYGYSDYSKPIDLLLPILNINKTGFLYFDSIPDQETRGNICQFMLAVIAPQISYFHSLKLKTIFHDLANHIKRDDLCDISLYGQMIIKTLTTSLMAK